MTFECAECGWKEDGNLQPSQCPGCGSRMEAASMTLPETLTTTKEESNDADPNRMESQCR